ncbi:MAG: hypothetical protein GTN89_05715 [Acidobacteria bacterium]|nr:hypothetical protein [Acidobacteriota bacterium]NIO60869.1 hypothetical protein [Acidobacteriota bacterium]NIQ29864.1 hypothetical protein [Acidobacteriota bacterium]NIQ87330.1 hypothetical protein [Acidobacteriota bacterium]
MWGKNVGSSYDLVESRFENGGWTTPAVITAGVSSSADPEPAIAIDKQTGNVHVVYLTNDSNPQVMHVQAPWDLSSWNPPVQVSEIGENAIRPTAVIHQGVLTVAYESHVSGIGNTPRVITVATADGLGGFTHETLTSSHGSSPNRPQLHTGVGNALWVDWIDGTNEMAWSKWNSATGWGPVQLEPFTDIEDREYHVRGRVRKKATE